MALGIENIKIGIYKTFAFIEVPKDEKEIKIVSYSEVRKTQEFKKSKSLEIPFGKTAEGKDFFKNVAEFPHLLIGGMTGAGKSVLIHALIVPMLEKNSPENLQMIMIDPKGVELILYSDIPHLVRPVITDHEEAEGTLNYLVAEMRRRYELLSKNKLRHIDDYNIQFPDKKMTRIVCVIDEIADLMDDKNIDIETPVKSLGDMARASGINLILCTQKPDAQTLTSKIKTNLRTRIALQVSNNQDSRHILDCTGAEKLRGKGDMLFLKKGEANAERLQGYFISDDELKTIIEEIKNKYKRKVELKKVSTVSSESIESIENYQAPEFIENFLKEIKLNSKLEKYYEDEFKKENEENKILDFETYRKEQTKENIFEDELIDEVVKKAIEENKITIEWISEKFKVGKTRATKIFTEIKSLNIILDKGKTKPKTILINNAEWEKIKSNLLK